MTRPKTDTNQDKTYDGLADAALQVRDAWRTYALFLRDHTEAPASTEASELLLDALRADEDLQELIEHPEHYREEHARLSQLAARERGEQP